MTLNGIDNGFKIDSQSKPKTLKSIKISLKSFWQNTDKIIESEYFWDIRFFYCFLKIYGLIFERNKTCIKSLEIMPNPE